MAVEFYPYVSQLRLELGLRNRSYARGRAHVASHGGSPVIVYGPEDGRHGNFFEPAYAAMTDRPEWMKRFDKIHSQGRSLPKAERRWRELDSSMSSDALLMNIFCTPGVAESAAVQRMLGVVASEPLEFGWKAKVPFKSGRFDRTEVDLRWGALLIEAKLTESDFQCREALLVESYRDFDAVFDREMLPRVEIRTTRRREAIELTEDYTQEWEPPSDDDGAGARAFQAEIAAKADALEPKEPGYTSYQLIRNVLAAYANGGSFCVIHDQRRPDLREAWFCVMSAVKSAEIRTRCKVLTWQELAEVLPEGLSQFLDLKYGIVAPGCVASAIG